MTLSVVAEGLSNAIGLASPHDGSGRLFALQQTGEIRVWTGGAQVLATPFLDLSTIVSGGGEQGLLGLAFHPSYESNGFFYVNYTDLSGDTVIARYSVSAGDPNLANPASALQILAFDQPAGNHNGGDLHFGPDGYLYISSGDGGAGPATAQNASSLLGKILRIDVDGDDFPADPDRNYAIPPGNPFAGGGGAPEVWLLGLRNPWRFSFDSDNADLFIGDVGDGDWEEIDHLPGGGVGAENLGWPCYEGPDPFDLTGCGPAGDYVFPIASLPHDSSPNNNCSIIGGSRYRGSLQPSMSGWYFFSDWCTGKLWATEQVADVWQPASNVADLSTFFHTDFAEGENGELYLVGGWNISQLLGPDAIFQDGFESGDPDAWSSVVP